MEHTAAQPDRRVRMLELDRALVRAAGLLRSAQHVLAEARAAGLAPRPRLGTEVVARLLGLRYNHPSQRDGLELLPGDPATRAEAAYSFAKLLELSPWAAPSAEARADGFDLPELTDWQRRILTRAVSFVGLPYVWGGTSERTQTLFGVTSRGGFDCSGFAWRIYRLESYPGAPQLQTVLRGRTASAMAGEVPVSARIRRRSEPAARRPDLLLGARNQRPAGRRLPHGHLRRRRLVRPLVQPGDDDDDALRVVRRPVRLGPAAAPRSRLGLGAFDETQPVPPERRSAARVAL